MFSDLTGKRVVITGASRGIGAAMTNAFLDEGCHVVGMSRSKNSITVLNERFTQLVCDVTDLGPIRTWLNQEEHDGRRVDVVINNAGQLQSRPLIECDEVEFDTLFAVNTRATFFVSQLFARHMGQRGGGVIINTGSFAASNPSVSNGMYAASKAAVVSLTRSMAAEWAPQNIRVNAISPGVIRTEMTDPGIAIQGERMLDAISLRRFGSPAEVASVALFLSSNASAYLTGINVDVSGGKLVVQDPASAWHLPKDKKST